MADVSVVLRDRATGNTRHSCSGIKFGDVILIPAACLPTGPVVVASVKSLACQTFIEEFNKTFQCQVLSVPPDPRAVKLSHVFECDEVRSDLVEFFPSYKLDSGFHQDGDHRSSFLLQHFAILSSGDHERGLGMEVIPSLTHQDVPTARCKKFDSVALKSSPFGGGGESNLFLHTYTTGVVCSAQGCLLLTDAPSAPGSEGGALYRVDKNRGHVLAGMVLSGIVWTDGEYLGLTLCAQIQTILSAAITHFNPHPTHTTTTQAHDHPLAHRVVMLHSSHHKASGIILHSSPLSGMLILTTAHSIFKPGLSHQVERLVTVTHRDLDLAGIQAHVLYNPPWPKPYDIAFLSTIRVTSHHTSPVTSPVTSPITSHVTLPAISHVTSQFIGADASWLKGDIQLCTCEDICRKGQGVVSMGYSLHPGPSVSSGVVSNTIYHPITNEPVMVQTSCSIHQGDSGGAIVCSSCSGLVSVIVAHASDSDGVALPRINFSVPFTHIHPIVQKYKEKRCSHVFSQLYTDDEFITKVWSGLWTKPKPISPKL